MQPQFLHHVMVVETQKEVREVFRNPNHCLQKDESLFEALRLLPNAQRSALAGLLLKKSIRTKISVRMTW